MVKALLLALVALNGLTFLLYGLDKWKASRARRRIPELHLLWPLATGGVVGGWLGMSFFRHKTRKRSFQVKAVLASLVNCLWIWIWTKTATAG